LPLFADLDDATLKRLGRAFQTIYANADDILIRKDNAAKRVFFIATGAVELQVAGQTWRLGPGEMFGQMAILMQKPRRALVRAIAPSTLLVLDEDRFRRLLMRSDRLQQAVRASAEKRGIAPERLLADITAATPPATAED
jgi:CPA1 family monovalent cation:H+ antiporter